jgi:hypothetical protein
MVSIWKLILCEKYQRYFTNDLCLWCESHDHATHTQRHQFPEKPSKSGLIGVWHKDNFYLGTSTIGNGKPPPNEYWFTNEKY